jgi:Methane oxygenase PmoA
MRSVALVGILALTMHVWSRSPSAGALGVRVVADQAARRVDITVDGKPFTSYLWPTSLKKPVLYPLITDEGITVTRGYPLEPRPHERVDHPHHAGLWFNYGNVNGFDFWNNSDAIKAEDRAKMGTILQTRIVSTGSGSDRGELVTDSVWVTGEGKELLDQTTRYVFSRRVHERVIDEVITLKALDRAVFHDDKEGVLGMRVAGWLESPEEKGGVFLDANGRPTKVDKVENSDASGEYLTSEGVKGGAAWGTRGAWCSLTGHTGDHTVTIAILDHPGNPGFPTYWHARGYGLFAANPLGRSIFDPKQPALDFTLEKGGSATFRYRVLLISHPVSAADLTEAEEKFAAQSE